MIIRYLVASLIALIAAAVLGAGLSLLFISTPLQNVLGPRYSEFDFFGVLGVAIVSPLFAVVATWVAISQGADKLQATFQWKSLFSLLIVPQVTLLVLTLLVDGEWAWAVLIHLATCGGILAGAATALVWFPEQ